MGAQRMNQYNTNKDIVGSCADSVASAVVREVENKVGDWEVLVVSSCHITDGYSEAQNKQERLHKQKIKIQINLHPTYIPLKIASHKVKKPQGRFKKCIILQSKSY